MPNSLNSEIKDKPINNSKTSKQKSEEKQNKNPVTFESKSNLQPSVNPERILPLVSNNDKTNKSAKTNKEEETKITAVTAEPELNVQSSPLESKDKPVIKLNQFGKPGKICPICNREYSSTNQLKDHLCRAHFQEKIAEKYCNKSGNKCTLLVHF